MTPGGDSASILQFYTTPGIMTDPGEYAKLLEGLPKDVLRLCEVVQGVLIHIYWAEQMGVSLSEERKQEVSIRPVAPKLTRILELDDHPLTEPRPLEKRLVSNCRDFSVLLTAILQHQGVPARARAGFGTYFIPGRYEDHWVCECWNSEEQRWVLVDAQLDALQRKALHIPFDPLDVPRDRFVIGGRAWQMYRSGEASPDLFGIFDMHGPWFIRGDLVRDFLALNKVDILPWDPWGHMAGPKEAILPEELTYLDRMAELTIRGDVAFDEIRSLYESDPVLHPPAGWKP